MAVSLLPLTFSPLPISWHSYQVYRDSQLCPTLTLTQTLGHWIPLKPDSTERAVSSICQKLFTGHCNTVQSAVGLTILPGLTSEGPHTRLTGGLCSELACTEWAIGMSSNPLTSDTVEPLGYLYLFFLIFWILYYDFVESEIAPPPKKPPTADRFFSRCYSSVVLQESWFHKSVISVCPGISGTAPHCCSQYLAFCQSNIYKWLMHWEGVTILNNVFFFKLSLWWTTCAQQARVACPGAHSRSRRLSYDTCCAPMEIWLW